MSKVCEIDTRRPHQVRLCRHARKVLHRRNGGIIIADGVGLGKTYEALATVCALLTQGEHGKERKRRQNFSILILVPPGLVTKWASELEQEHFISYIKNWRYKPVRRAVYSTLSEGVVVLRRVKDLRDHSGQQRGKQHELPPGCYIVNINLIYKRDALGRKATQLFKTHWDAVIVDEAHRVAGRLTQEDVTPLLTKERTKTLLLTATPFQLAPVELKGLLSDTFGGTMRNNGNCSPKQLADLFYNADNFRDYRSLLNRYFRYKKQDDLQSAARLCSGVSRYLRERIVRNPKHDNRAYHFVDKHGIASKLPANIFELGDVDLAKILSESPLIELGDAEVKLYLDVRNRLARDCVGTRRTFIAAALRQLLSSYGQFHRSKVPARVKEIVPKDGHPKLNALEALVKQIISRQIRVGSGSPRRYFEKVLIFSTYVGSNRTEISNDDLDHGTARSITKSLSKILKALFPRPKREEKLFISKQLVSVLDEFSNVLVRNGDNKAEDEYYRLKGVLLRFAGSRCSHILLSNRGAISSEKRYLRQQIRAIVELESHDEDDAEQYLRTKEHRERRLMLLYDRYSTRELIARYDGATAPEDRDRHLRGFNSPYAPLVMVASSVGQEGIDLQKYCSHVIHYDLEWNPAKLEQREGRVDRQGREAQGPVNVYFMICKHTYDERVLHVMVNRMRWHQLLLPHRKFLHKDPSIKTEKSIDERDFHRVMLDLRPRNNPPLIKSS